MARPSPVPSLQAGPFLHPAERLEQRRHQLPGDHRPAVGDLELCLPATGTGADGDPAAADVVPHRVVHQVADHAFEQQPVPAGRGGRKVGVDAQGQLARGTLP